MLTFVLGGLRSGKSAFARRLAEEAGPPVTYLATGVAVDAETERRIEAHRRARPRDWICIEEPVSIGTAVPSGSELVLLESVDGWLANRVWERDSEGDRARDLEDELVAECSRELAGLRAAADRLIAVSSEVGLALVPTHPLGRVFADVLGILNQRLAAEAEATYLVVAGLPVRLDGDSIERGTK
ncbi:MAG: bifunctional adenosylcobinamide kinase/adenosylcobinamide-phosphate guanylyltransferase [Actinobacteria bacterium]|nr:MAG: bifunctional adenosylcobinamide kinase/adenosylcobinamide-phosphate guanylyltransferase [Actinomycetota bacterium]